MSSAANVSAPRAMTNATVPQLSKRALDALKKGASVEIWAECEPYTIEIGGVAIVEKHKILCSIPTALIRHFSSRCKREIGANETKRLQVPFIKEPTRLVVSWMMAGGGSTLGTAEVAYPKNELRKLEILKNLAVHWEIDSLVDLIKKDIVAATPILPAVPTASSAPKPAAKKAVPEEKLCWFCNKPGHMRRDCAERSAVHVTWSQAETHSMKGAAPAAAASGPSKQTLTPISGRIAARDPSGIIYHLQWNQVELEFEGLRADGRLKITGTANLGSW